MNRISAGFWALLVLFLGGLWLVLSPFALVASQPAGRPWTAATISNVAAGGGLTLVALAGMVGYLAFWLRDLLAAAGGTSEERTAGPEGESGSPVGRS
ncbi:MAG: hypothetical protein QJR14_05655 [Bacillota bacterium]|nr:hypothetical protein [Bacillota bacterium]